MEFDGSRVGGHISVGPVGGLVVTVVRGGTRGWVPRR